MAKNPSASGGRHKRCRFDPGSGRSPFEGRHGNSLQYSCLEDPVDRGGLQAMGSQRVRRD